MEGASFPIILAIIHAHDNPYVMNIKQPHFDSSVPHSTARSTLFATKWKVFPYMFLTNLGHIIFPSNLCSSLIMLVWNDVCISVCCNSNMLWTKLLFVHKSPILLVKYFFRPTICIFNSVYRCISHMHDSIGPKPHNFLLHQTQHCSSNLFQKHRKLFAYNFESVEIINLGPLCIWIHISLPNIHYCLHYFS